MNPTRVTSLDNGKVQPVVRRYDNFSTTTMKGIISYTIASLLLLLLLLIPTFWKVYAWHTTVAITVGCILSDIVGRRIIRRSNKKR
ncbi:hypothetical protein [Porphyromonas circumdentaria]|uniref:hypothetical protein n=1 Tax=Porphyromonas circumdentaria TaxID=29524 RepID=UPI0026DBD2FE|nr:hypothetical protein [Porphyromonas circumdentaria]MDO4722345.1 hypothetical protein [Porphyromonas circumdentaria]